MGVQKQAVMSRKAETSYTRFFENAFTEQDLDELIQEGGATSFENFKEKSRKHVKEREYWDRMFNGRFKGRDGKERPSKFNRLGKAIYSRYVEGRQARDIFVWQEIRRETKTGFTTYRIRRVSKGSRIEFRGRLYKGGMFLPRDYGQ